MVVYYHIVFYSHIVNSLLQPSTNIKEQCEERINYKVSSPCGYPFEEDKNIYVYQETSVERLHANGKRPPRICSMAIISETK